MMRVGLGGISVLAVLAATSTSSMAQAVDLNDLPRKVLKQLQPGMAIEQVIAQALQPIRQLDAKGDGLDAGDIDLREAMNNAEQRAGQASQVLRADLDGDGAVSAAEVDSLIELQLSRRDTEIEEAGGTKIRNKMTEEYLRYDTDKNGSVTFDEMRQIPPKSGRRASEFETYRMLLSLDPSGDGQLTVAEMEEVIRKAFAMIDTDLDGEISRAEFRPYQQKLQAAMEVANVPPCNLPKPAAGDQFISLGMYYGATQPTLAVTGQDDVTHLSRVTIEPGTRPIHLVVTAYEPTIWRLEGAVDRVSQLVVIPREQNEAGPSELWAGAAVIGLAKEKISFAEPRSCGGYYYKQGSKEWRRMEQALTAGVGRAPDTMLGTYGAEVIAVPSGKVTEKGSDRDVIVTGNTVAVVDDTGVTVLEGGLDLEYQENWLSKSGGIVEVKPEEVVAPGKVEPYLVIPGQEGLRLLVEQGVLTRTPNGYRVVKPLPRWPAGLAGAHSVTFILPKGIPEPEGHPGHSRVIMEP